MQMSTVIPAQRDAVGLHVPVRGMTCGRSGSASAPAYENYNPLRAIMLKGATLENLQYDAIALGVLMLAAMTVAVTRFRRTLD